MTEVLKAMQDLDVAVDVETISIYVLPVFSSIDAARQAFKVALYACEGVCARLPPSLTALTVSAQDAGVSLECEGLLSSEVRAVANKNLAQLYALRK